MQDTRLRNNVSHALARLSRQVTRSYNRALKPFGLSSVQAHILMVLWDEGPMTIGELQSHLAMGSSTLTGALDRMEKLELVRRTPVAGDRRSFRIEPAQWSRRQKRDLDAALTAVDDKCFANLSQKERRDLLRLLSKASASIEDIA